MNLKIENKVDIDDHLKNLIKSEIEGEVYFDDVTREIYSTDASIYRIVPLCVVTPKTIKDIKTLVQISNEYGIPILPRGGGSSLSGQTVNKAIVIDFTKHINKVVNVDKTSMTAIAQPGITIDRLNQILKSQNLLFTPDPSTTNRATVGGVIGNNSCGAHSIIYGKTIDNVKSLKTILSNGEDHVFKKIRFSEFEKLILNDSFSSNLYLNSINLFKKYTDELTRRYPDIQRRVGGYNLD